ncbi:AZOBR_p60025 family cell surface glycopolymer formation protein [Leptospira santarosai]|uniref:Dolichyl-phosphate-mannose-protein mannosyltransferase n=2 Tax=Leptospira santarosai TaxID=28183 RepID=A0AB73LNY9_9LEPT|nr:membrane protein [Leptospira santarosai]ASV11829.1 hypothetical protein B2G51_08935 [Leptospira santarosai]EMF89878.1 putative membrane protein [Leptospira santarosai str. ST188]EMO43937.1 putative membrane protein [Leptospira santarosai str. ZUN179]EMO72395.1 putative membrane protein [Leptospira santarosai str. 200403458]EMO98096.1 putative membrane protein [Leptospira santarosai str. 200702252]
MQKFEFFLRKIDSPLKGLIVLLGLYGFVTLTLWSRYEWNPSSMVNFGEEFVKKNETESPKGVIAFKGKEGDLGAGYDGQIFYYYSRSISNFSFEWPVGFDATYRAPRIGYPLLVSVWGIFGKWGNIAGMYILSISLLYLSYLALRVLLKDKSHWALLYLVSPFTLASYSVLVSDTIMVSLIVLAIYFYEKESYVPFYVLSGLALVTKEPALFYLFSLGLAALSRKDVRKMLIVGSTLLVPVLWQIYLKYTLPGWTPTRLAVFMIPFEGIYKYLMELAASFTSGGGIKQIVRSFSKFPLVLQLITMFFIPLTGSWKKATFYKVGFSLVILMLSIANHYHFWSEYINTIRLFTFAIPLYLFIKAEDEGIEDRPFLYLFAINLVLILARLTVLYKVQDYVVR